jgi:hypothetical protein
LRRPGLWTALGLIFAALGLAACGTSDPESPVLSTTPGLSPSFGWEKSDYVVRCDDEPVAVEIAAPDGWTAAVGKEEPRGGNYETDLELTQGKAFSVSVVRDDGEARTFHIRCLPPNFPEYSFSGSTPESGFRLFMVQMRNQYAALFDRHGAPVWWYRFDGEPNDAQLMPDGTIAFTPVVNLASNHFEIRTLTGRLIRKLAAVGTNNTDSHDLQLLPNGNYLLGTHRFIPGIDTARFGGGKRTTLSTAEVQELAPDGSLVWSWRAWPRIALSETGRWWNRVLRDGLPYDVHHWNSAERRGNTILLSFRHLDAVYAVNRKTGRIIWKLGGERTRHSLEVLDDPRSEYPFGGQHDARFVDGNRITIFDNASLLDNPQPRAVEYRIDPARGTATLLDEVTDPEVPRSIGFGSARRTPGGDWLIGWGPFGTEGLVGNYSTDGQVESRLTTPGGVTYRANPVTGPGPSIARIRQVMDQIAGRPDR